MKEKILNKYIKVKLVEYQTYVSQERSSYEQIGIVLNKDELIEDIPIGSKVWFDGFIAKKYPVEGKEGEFEWYVHFDEVVKVEYA